ncbi:MAG: hypothetical protein JNK48_35085 [Bryobacterales bacterium]|nr:hypothetical protein [Bryobacterales bacterium]
MKRLCLLIPLLASIAAADPLVFSEVSIFTTITADNSIPPTSHYGYLPIGSPIEVEVFGSIPAWGKFTVERNNPHSTSFMSAMGNAGGQMGVGVSGLRFVGGSFANSPLAVALVEWSVTNTGTVAIPIEMDYKIPQMELWVTRFSAFSNAYGEARLEATQYLADGSELASWKPFSYWARLYYYRDNGDAGLEESEDIKRFEPEAITDSITYEKVTYPIIEGYAPLGVLEPGERIALSYRLLSYVYSSAEAGGQAFVGDPFHITYDGFPLQVRAAAATGDVPEPATAGLAAAALALLLAGRKRRSQA